MGISSLLVLVVLIFTFVKCNIKPDWVSESKQPLPFFRRHVEEIYEENSLESKEDDQRSKLIAFLIKNVEEVFKDTDINLLNEFAENLEPTTAENLEPIKAESLEQIKVKNLLANTNISAMTFGKDFQRETTFIHDNNDELYENLSIHSMPFLVSLPTRTPIKKLNKVTKRDKLEVSNALLLNESPTMLVDDNILGLQNITQSMVHLEKLLRTNYVIDDEVQPFTQELKRSCIHCNNVMVPECASPKNKLQVNF